MQSNSNGSQRLVYIVDGLRTPFIKAKGKPGPFAAADLAMGAVRPLLAKQPFQANQLDEVVVGCVSPSEEEANIARIIALRAGCGEKVPGYTVQRNCASGLQAIVSAYQNIQAGHDLVLAGGTEAMSRTPLLYSKPMTHWFAELNMAKTLPHKLKVMAKFRPKFLAPVIALLKGLTDPVVNMNMGQTAQMLAHQFNITRDDMDVFAVTSHTRAAAAYQQACMEEVTALYSPDGHVYEQDDGIRTDSSVTKLAKLKPVFEKFGSVTAGNSSQITDGAAFLILASEAAVNKYQLKPLAVIKDYHWAGLAPEVMGLGPIHAMTPLLQKHQLGLNDIDHIEINEAFAAQVIACQKAWQDESYCAEKLALTHPLGTIETDKLNPNGGAIALGHPVGASGARIVLHCAKSLVKTQQQRAIASLCIGGGQGGAMLIERVTEAV